MSAVSEFQTAGAEQRKARSAKLVLVVGLQTRGVAVVMALSSDECVGLATRWSRLVSSIPGRRR